MLWYWSAEGGGGVYYADPPTNLWYEQRVLNDPEHPLQQQPDSQGVVTGPAN